jgi:hypothetical protein
MCSLKEIVSGRDAVVATEFSLVSVVALSLGFSDLAEESSPHPERRSKAGKVPRYENFIRKKEGAHI